MQKSNFVDYVKIYLKSGAGGAGSVHWRREKHVPQGGPDGGDGGNGGNIYLEGDAQLWTLLDLKYRKYINAENGERGSGQKRHGKNGKDIILKVPVGTVAIDSETDQVLAEINHDKERILILSGGRGGLGNWHFRSATNQTPDYAQPGEPFAELALVLELKLLADVGLVGFPNAGKSTLLSVLTAAKPEIADYAFTTLVPNLGIVRYKDYLSFVMADIPGIIEGASEGKGLGTTFLRHIERNAVLLFMVSIDTEDVTGEYGILRRELEKYSPELMQTPHLLAISKCDLADDELISLVKEELPTDVPYCFISSVTQRGLEELKDMLWRMLEPGKGKSDVGELSPEEYYQQ